MVWPDINGAFTARIELLLGCATYVETQAERLSNIPGTDEDQHLLAEVQQAVKANTVAVAAEQARGLCP